MDNLDGVGRPAAVWAGMSDFDPTRPFTSDQARTAGLSRQHLRGRSFRRVVRGIYVAAGAPTSGSRLRAGLLATGSSASFVSHHDAARLWGGVVPHAPEVHVSVPRGASRRRRQGVLIHSSARRPVRFRGLPVTSPVDTFLDLAAVLDLVDLVVLGDSLVRRERVTTTDLVKATSSASGRHSRRAERAARLVRPGVDSPMETRTRLLMVLAGLPEPEVDIRFLGEHGEVLRRTWATGRPGWPWSTTANSTGSAATSTRRTSSGTRSSTTAAGGSS